MDVVRASRRAIWALPLLLLLHQNPWVWADDSLVAGIPVSLAYHLFLCVLVTALMALIVLKAWPDYPEDN